MTTSTWRWLPVLGLLTFWSATAEAATIRDDGKMFSSSAVEKANAKLEALEKKYRWGFVLETHASVPSGDVDRVKKLEGEPREKYFATLLNQRAQLSRVKGVFVHVIKSPGHVSVGEHPDMLKSGFKREHAQQLRSELLTHFKEKKFDEGLASMIEKYEAILTAHVTPLKAGEVRPLATGRSTAAVPPPPATSTTSRSATSANATTEAPSIMGWVILIGVVIVGVWIVQAVLRALFGGGGGGNMAMGGPGYGGGYGGGGGGFFQTMLGGMFGAMAGHYLYDSFFNSHSNVYGGDHQGYGSHDSGDGGPVDYGATGGDFDSGDSSTDYAGGGDSGSGDFGDSGGGDFGGGDFGGGGDF